ncbi:MAG: hypothetical protein C0407_13530, partial [Desulfobacca sp.]|nr:hypothetical protein [Desulfobacca sp.]
MLIMKMKIIFIIKCIVGGFKRMVQLKRKKSIHPFIRYAVQVINILVILITASPVLAVRPFVTDDARVLGADFFLLETSVRRDPKRFQNMNLMAFGPTDKIELTIGFVDGFPLEGDNSGAFSIAGPLGQFKYLFTEGTANGYPGVAVVVGANTPYGSSNFSNPSWTTFAYLAFTESLGNHEQILIHANLGINYAKPETEWRYAVTWGLGTQIRLFGGLHYVGEIFHGDPYSGDSGGAF